MVFVMVVLGGATRLTESGLSMVEWQPLKLLPPLTELEWQTEFEKYRQYPEFQKDLDAYLGTHNTKRPNQGRGMNSRTPA